MVVLTVGLRRSGTTAFFRAFEADKRLVCFDEPFNPLYWKLPEPFLKATTGPFVRLLEEDSKLFWRMFSPIELKQELGQNLTSEQKRYLRYLADSGEDVFIDTTRCWMKLNALREVLPEALIIYLYREPAAFVTSHILPHRPELAQSSHFAVKRMRLRLRRIVNRLFFWSVKKGFDEWGYETLLHGMDLPENAAARLLWLWKEAYKNACRFGAPIGSRKWLMLSFEAFCADPEDTLRKVYREVNMEYVSRDLGWINRNPPSGYMHTDPRWRNYPSDRIGRGGV
jgi:hypothetical protein